MSGVLRGGAVPGPPPCVSLYRCLTRHVVASFKSSFSLSSVLNQLRNFYFLFTEALVFKTKELSVNMR